MRQHDLPASVKRAIVLAERTERIQRVLPSPNHAAPSLVKAIGRVSQPRGMNKLEAAWGDVLLGRKAIGTIAWYAYEAITLKLADDTRYTPDWPAMLANGELVMFEVKGPHRREDSIIKLRVAARMFPMRFVIVTRDGDAWNEKEVTP